MGGRMATMHPTVGGNASSWGSPATCGKQAGRYGDVDICDQQSFLTIRLVAQQSPIRTDDCRRGRRAGTGAIDGCEIAGVLGGAAQSRLFVKRIRGIGENRRAVRAGLGFVDVRVKHDMRSTLGGPADSL